jgi:ubiquinone/menaquinone biosynthesis C-methylase UbiE
MSFLPSESEHIHSHYYEVVAETITFCGDVFDGATVLNVGCGDMLTDFGFLGHGVKRVVGLDIDAVDSNDRLEAAKSRLATAGITVRPDYRDILSYQMYDGCNFPFPNDFFDFVFSWSAFEHIRDVPAVLSEIRRVVKTDGYAFIQVFPWYHSYYGSHLTDYISEPYFHLNRDEAWVRTKLSEAVRNGASEHVVDYMFGQYKTLNKYSANMFYRAVLDCGFRVVKTGVISYEMDLSEAPGFCELSDLMMLGTKVLIRKG